MWDAAPRIACSKGVEGQDRCEDLFHTYRPTNWEKTSVYESCVHETRCGWHIADIGEPQPVRRRRPRSRDPNRIGGAGRVLIRGWWFASSSPLTTPFQTFRTASGQAFHCAAGHLNHFHTPNRCHTLRAPNYTPSTLHSHTRRNCGIQLSVPPGPCRAPLRFPFPAFTFEKT